MLAAKRGVELLQRAIAGYETSEAAAEGNTID
jgi:hypothetical protein